MHAEAAAASKDEAYELSIEAHDRPTAHELPCLDSAVTKRNFARGYAEAGSGTGIGSKQLLAAASNGLLRSLIHRGKDNTAMRPFDAKAPTAVANLTDEEIDSIIQYLRANAW